jgi:signal transduction histidine kinase
MSPRKSHEIIYQYMMEDASVFVMRLDRHGTILSINRYAEKLVGSGFIIKKGNLFDVVVNFGHLPSLDELFAINDTPQLLNISTKFGLPQSLYFKFFPLDDDFLMVGQQDIEEVENLRVNLVSAVNDANSLSRELQKKNVMLTRLNELKNQFMGMAAHDLRNPLAIILAYSEFLHEDSQNVLSDKNASLMLKIRNSSEFMLNLLNDLLDVSKIESGNIGLRLELTDIQTLVQGAVELNQVLASKKKIELRYHRSKNLPRVNIDLPKIEQVINNILSNAVKYSRCETIVNIEIVHRDSQLIVSVRDQGQGIAPEDQQRIFQPFQTVALKGTAGEKSTGLGLMIAQKIVTAHGGRIWVESAEGQGTTFCFSIPVSAVEQGKVSWKEADSCPTEKKESNLSLCPFLNTPLINEYKVLDEDFFKELLAMFFCETPLLLRDIEEFAGARNRFSLKMSLTKLRSSCFYIGASSLAVLCDSLLNMPDNELFTNTVDYSQQLATLFEKTRQAFIALQNGG